MDFLHGDIKKLYFKYLGAAFGSALISSIYGVVDMAMVGQYHGPEGTAALAVVAPIWNVIYSLGLLMGIGGSVLFSNLRGQSENNTETSNELFTSSLIGAIVLALISWFAILVFEQPILHLFGADEALSSLASRYLLPIKIVFPLYLFNQFFAAYLRNDGDPGLATKAVLTGGIFNIFGDYFFVFTLDLGIFGAGVATAIGAVISFVMMLGHFFSKKNTIQIRRPKALLANLKKITMIGFSTFFVDVAMGIVTMLFNRQIQKYLGTDALAVYGIIINISTIVQSCAYSVGQAAQPIISTNFGAAKKDRIKETMKYAIATAVMFGLAWTIVAEAVPNMFVHIFMTPTESVLAIAPFIIRTYGSSFLLLPMNILSTYYFQAILQPKPSFIVSVGRGAIISGALILLLPLITPSAIWFAMPLAEAITFVYVLVMMKKLG